MNKTNYLPSKRHLQFIKLAGDLAEQTCEEANSLGFMSRLLLMVNLPYRNPGDETRVWIRKNGNVSLIVTPSYDDSGVSVGLPYGTYPRLILAYLITQAVKTSSPHIYLGKSFRDFLTLLDLKKGGYQYTQIKKQIDRTLSTSFSWTYKNNQYSSRINVQVSRKSQLWWNPRLLDQTCIWDNYIILNTDFYNEIVKKAVPLDLRALAILKNSPLGLDLYMFISWRVFKLKKPVYISWKNLQDQVGGQYEEIYVFSRDCRKHFNIIQAISPYLNIKILKGRMCLYPQFYIHTP